MRTKVEITAEIIKQATTHTPFAHTPFACPYALAINKKLPCGYHSSVVGDNYHIYRNGVLGGACIRRNIPLPSEAENRINDYDKTGIMKPHVIEVDIPKLPPLEKPCN